MKAETQWQVRSRFRKLLPKGYRLETIIGYDYWWVDDPSRSPVATGKTAREAVYRTLMKLQEEERA